MNRSGCNAENRISRRFLCFLLTGSFLISSGGPLWASAPQSTTPAQTAPAQTTPAAQSAPAQSSPPQSTSSPSIQVVDPQPLPEAPQAQSTQTPADQQPAVTPSGAAGAKAAVAKGTPVAQPTGAAVAPPRQRGHRSLIIKIGLLAGAGVAVGTAVALSAKSPSRPPGAPSSSHP